MNDLSDLAWPASRLGEALVALAPVSAPPNKAAPPIPPNAIRDHPDALTNWVEASARYLGFEAVPVDAFYPELSTMLAKVGKALLRLPGVGAPRFLALLRQQGERLRVLGPDYRVRTISRAEIRAALCQDAEAELRTEIEQLLKLANIQHRSADTAAALLHERLRHRRVASGWLVRTPAAAPLREQAAQAGLGRQLAWFLAAHAGAYGLLLLAWVVVGRGALQGRLESGWLAAAALLLAMLVLLRVAADWLQGVLSLRFGALLRQRLYEGALILDPQAVRGEGIGQLLGRVFEAQAVESLALSGGLAAAVVTLELVAATLILAWGSAGWMEAALLMVWIAVCIVLALRHFRARERWTRARRTITHELIERMVGHRTRLAQEPKARWHEAEDSELAAYLEQSRTLDRTSVLLATLAPRGWLLVGFLALASAFAAGAAPERLAVILGAVLLAYQSFRRLVLSLPALAGAAIAWEQTAPLIKAVGSETAPLPDLAIKPGPQRDETPSPVRIEGDGIAFCPAGRNRAVLKNVRFAIRAGERLLLEGPSGSGKSTFAAVLAGLRGPDAGVLLLDGMDRATLGERSWRRRVALAPQFHENHVISETFAFNLLMGRSWPPTQSDLAEAESICRELGLGELLDRMPAGLMQMVGENGWQLSHGERSRLYLARALLQGADLVVLDESFAALDPKTLRVALGCVRRRAPTLLVVAHP